ncbi:MAG TPA: bifunctional oligoribonuclease/PAP phosphatase NrnA [Candidatus Sumerlaeota bacterium]|nr:MAG: Bifunctional oligoribonuclease and PAP phosphatase NrnA [candidate division BRC1 bacterium ADurb.Bin183]HOE63284.1 bifunctional oligoribonuclease/PAP phosphatase NrnA [Candidatus Sumerlaeota bacterium]HRS00529.1 bifunctional oligoribonuclease/PAP phosphatase NrnA [Candidatus Sumerlaeia bacterium]HON50642.1 bifunctional oligoribonuclease/PAP phosphatase NrnA [Candidatus Sumerlaeota bacterium]HOR65464.1 bifunctional oligoribonuclease/PAP phosphatase NrnA [Candidatus Sumerlaeota bacterium]
MAKTNSGDVIYPAQFGDSIKKIGRIIRDHQRFLVCGHVRPDGDCVGSQMALYHLLTQMGKDVQLYNSGPIPPYFKFVKHIEKLRAFCDPAFEPEVCIYVDCGALDRANGNVKRCGVVINIDHHKSNEHFGDVNYVDWTATAVGEQLYHIISEMGEPISKDIAGCIYLSILADSGSFTFSNTSSMTFKVASRMVEAGADPAEIAQGLYEERSPQSVSLKAQVLSNMHFLCGGRIVWGEITQTMYRAAGGEEHEPDGLASEMRGMTGVEVSILIHEIPEGGLRAGFRSKGLFDVSRIAVELGGGGHVNASGCYVKGDYEAIKKNLLEISVRHMGE